MLKLGTCYEFKTPQSSKFEVTKRFASQEMDDSYDSAEILDDVDLEDGEIFEEEDPNSFKASDSAEPKEKPVKTDVTEGPDVHKKVPEPEKNHRNHESKPPRTQNVPFLNKGKRKQPLDDHNHEDRWRKDGKRSRRSHDSERDGERVMEEDEDFMLVRGNSPNNRIEEDLEKWARDGEDIEREMSRRPARSFRGGRGSSSRRGERPRGRGRGGRALRGSKRRRDDGDTCHFFLQGKCQRGSDCPYSHEILPPRKMELCKFYMKDCCAKKDKCLYMHNEFPCKYYHMGLKCFANKKCKFNHGMLTDPLKNILAKHLDTAPKDILGDFARREGRERDRDIRDRDSRDMRGDPRDMRGDPRDGRGDSREMRGDPRDGRGDSRDMRGDLRDGRGDSREMRGDPRDGRGDSRDMRGDPRDGRGDLRDGRGDSKEMRGDPRDGRGDGGRGDLRDGNEDSRENRGGPRDGRGDSREMRGDPRDGKGDPRDGRGDLRDPRGDTREIERRIGDLRDFLRSRNDRDKRLPSTFDTRVSTPDDARNSDGNHTPMPSPTQRSQDSMKSSDKDRDLYSPEHDKEKGRGRERDRDHEKHRHERSERSKEKKAKREKSREHKKERKERREKERERRREAKEKNDQKIEDINKILDAISATAEEDKSLNSSEAPVPLEEQEKKFSPSEENGVFPQHLPKKQRELFLRIQQQQREAESSQASANDDEDNMAEENWYSSDEETTPSTSLPSILHNLAQSTASSSSNTNTVTNTSSNSTVMPLLNLLASAAAAPKPADVNQTPAPVPLIPPNLDLSNLSSVFEALQKLSAANNKPASQPETTPATNFHQPTITTIKPQFPPEPPAMPEPPKPEIPRVRDPRLRMDGGAVESQRRSSLESYTVDTDLRLKPAAKAQSPQSSDIDLRSLPFKPVQHSAACEIDASLSAHPPLTWQLTPITVPKTDYASLQIQPRTGTNDPRLRLMVRAVADEPGLPRDPRHRLVDEPIRDPRSRMTASALPIMSPPSLSMMSGPPPTPRYDEDHRPQFYNMDSDMRQFPPPTPRLEDEIYTPGPTRPVDPRQRALSIDDPRRRPDDTDLRTQMTRVPFVNFTK